MLILLHEMGHYIEAQREGLHPKLPVFIPFLGAYVQYTRGNPWQTARVAIAGPILGGAAAFVCYLIGKSQGSNLMLALAYFGFFLNLFNLLPDRDLRRRRRVALGPLPAPGRRPGQGVVRLRAVLRHGARARARHVRRPTSPSTVCTAVTDDRQILDHPASDIEVSVAKITAELRAGFEKVAEVPRPAVAMFGSARVAPGSKPLRGRARRRPAGSASRAGP